MDYEQFNASVLEGVFSRGMVTSYLNIVEIEFNVLTELAAKGYFPLPAQQIVVSEGDRLSLITKCIADANLTNDSGNPDFGTTAIAGAPAFDWLAVHEAGHAIVALKLGLTLIGVRYNHDRTKGDTVLYNSDWQDESDDSIVRDIAVDVAGNLAQIILSTSDLPIGGRLSELYNDNDLQQGCCPPSDFCSANKSAHFLLRRRTSALTKDITDKSTWDEKRKILADAEAAAERILTGCRDSLEHLSHELLTGPLTGREIRQIVDAK